MLGAHPIYPVLLATDLAATKEFYHDRLVLEILNEMRLRSAAVQGLSSA